jgi:hypothetical protein
VSTLIYNCIQIEVLQTVRYTREPVYEGRTYLYTRHWLHVRGLMNPASTSYDFTGQSTANVSGDPPLPLPFTRRGVDKTRNLGQPGNHANLTDLAVRHLLLQPRGKLLYTCGGNDPAGNPAPIQFTFVGGAQDTQILEAPYRNRSGAAPDYSVDAAGGPFPRFANVWRVDGTGLFRVEFGVECFVNETHLFLLKPPLLLCNEWEMDTDIDRDGFTSKTVRGRAKFRYDVLASQKTVPDDYRDSLVHPVPPGFKRERLGVRALDDGCTVLYQFTDRQQSHSLHYFPGAQVSRVEAFYKIGQGAPSLEQLLSHLVDTFVSFAENPVGGVKGAGRAVAGLQIEATVRVWGNPYAKRDALNGFATNVLFAKMPFLLPQDQGGNQAKYVGTQMVYRGDLLGRFVEATASVTRPPITFIITNLFGFAQIDYPELMSQDDIVDTPRRGGAVYATTAPLPARSWPLRESGSPTARLTARQRLGRSGPRRGRLQHTDGAAVRISLDATGRRGMMRAPPGSPANGQSSRRIAVLVGRLPS